MVTLKPLNYLKLKVFFPLRFVLSKVKKAGLVT